MKQTFGGSCHCGAIQFETDIDFAMGTAKCNCSICGKARAWGAIVRPHEFRLTQGKSELSDYQFGEKAVHHYFCRHCGIRPFEKGHHEFAGGDFYSVQVSCLDNVDTDEITRGEIRYTDGRNDNYLESPTEVHHL